MNHMTNIKKMLAAGNEADAESALENLLFLGPQNTEALKLKSSLLRQKGDFDGEYLLWQKIIEIDREDHDAISYFRNRFAEEQERFYFIEEIPGQGKRFTLYPRALINRSLNALLGCSVFLIVPYLLRILTPGEFFLPILGASFLVMVILPWAAIVKAMFHAPKFILINKKGLRIGCGFKIFDFAWSDFSAVFMARGGETDDRQEELHLVLIPKAQENKYIIIDLNQETSSLRAKNYFLKEFKTHWEEIESCLMKDLKTPARRNLRI